VVVKDILLARKMKFDWEWKRYVLFLTIVVVDRAHGDVGWKPRIRFLSHAATFLTSMYLFTD
jgi:hypothetical protein